MEPTVGAPPSKSNSRVEVEPISKDSPSKRILESTTSRFERENVKSKILGKGTRTLNKDSKPSDRIQRLLIGKGTEMKQEDSLMDEYKTNDGNKDDNTQDANTHFVGRPTVRTKVHIRETRFQDLVIKPTSYGNVVEEGRENSQGKKQLKASESEENLEYKGGRTENASLRKGRVSQYSKIKSDASETKGEQVNENEKEADAGEAFLKKQQQLMHRGVEREDASKVMARGSDADDKYVGEKGLGKLSDLNDKEKKDDGAVDIENKNEKVVRESPIESNDEKTDEKDMTEGIVVEKVRDSKGEDKVKRDEENNDIETKKMEERKIMPTLDTGDRKMPSEDNEKTGIAEVSDCFRLVYAVTHKPLRFRHLTIDKRLGRELYCSYLCSQHRAWHCSYCN